MDYKEHLQEAGDDVYAIFESATDETRRALKAIHGFLDADFKAAETAIWQESQRGAANQAKITSWQAIQGFIRDFQDRLASIHLIDHAHDIQFNDDAGYYGPDVVPEVPEDLLNKAAGLFSGVMPVEDFDRVIGGGDVVYQVANADHYPAGNVLQAESKSQARRLAAQGVSFTPPPDKKVLPDDYDPNAGQRDPEPEDNVVAVQQAEKDAENPGKQSRAGETIRVDLGEGKVTVEHAGD